MLSLRRRRPPSLWLARLAIALAAAGWTGLDVGAPAEASAVPDFDFGAAPSLAPRARLAAVSNDANAFGAAPSLKPSLRPGQPIIAFVEPVGGQRPKSRGAIVPRIKPTGNVAAAPTIASTETPQQKRAPARALRLDRNRQPNIEEEPHTFFFTADIEQRPAPAALPIVLATDIPNAPIDKVVKMARGEAMVDTLRRAGVRTADRNAAAAALSKKVSLRRLRAGQEFRLVLSQDNQTLFQAMAEPDAGKRARADRHLLSLAMRPAAGRDIRLVRTGDAETVFVAEESVKPTTERIVTISGSIRGSLYASAKALGAPDGAIAELANMFAYDIDFQRDIFRGDAFEAVFKAQYDANGALAGSGDVLFGKLSWRGGSRSKNYYRFKSKNGGSRADYFDSNGGSAKRLLMKTPIDGARLSSGFGTRRHPILGYRKAHKGVDFAARRGTPIYAAGDGTIERMNRFGSFGNYVRIRHARGYKTAYAHLKGFKRGLRAGSRVEQGDVIGYVGTTGRSTGPHLHYEVHYKGRAVNPQKLKIATGVKLSGGERTRFFTTRDAIDALRHPEEPEEETPARKRIVRSH